MSKQDEHFMRRALQLAALGRSTVSPNPMVGCVIVHEDKIIGEGWHQKAGGPHAEVLAVRAVKNQALLKSATAYVTLEPCAHYGKTPPCADLLVEKKLKRVVIGAVDPNPLVAGKGIKILEKAGIEVQTGVLDDACQELNTIFFNFMKKKRPYIILKWAQTADGFIAKEDFNSKWISNTLSRQLVHKWRTEIDSICVGKNTAKFDNPSLTAREWSGKSPIRILIDHKLQAAGEELNLFDGDTETIVFYTEGSAVDRKGLKFVKLKEESFYDAIFQYLHKEKIQSVLVEGGSKTLQTFIDLKIWDEARIFHSPVNFKKGIKAPELSEHKLVSQKHIEDADQTDVLAIYHKVNN